MKLTVHEIRHFWHVLNYFSVDDCSFVLIIFMLYILQEVSDSLSSWLSGVETGQTIPTERCELYSSSWSAVLMMCHDDTYTELLLVMVNISASLSAWAQILLGRSLMLHLLLTASWATVDTNTQHEVGGMEGNLLQYQWMYFLSLQECSQFQSLCCILTLNSDLLSPV